MQTRLKLFVPLALLVLVFVVDKIALFPELRDAGRREATPMENIAINLKARLEQESLTAAGAAQSAKTYQAPVVFLGSSRSEIFQTLHPTSIAAAPGLSASDRAAVTGMRYETRGIVRAADLWLQYVMADTVLETEFKPATLLIEISPEMFNHNNPHGVQNRMGVNVFNARLLSDLFYCGTRDVKFATGLRLAFLSYNYNLRPERALINLNKGKDYLEQGAMSRLLLWQQPSVKALPADYVDFFIDRIPPAEYEKRFIDYTNHLVENDILREYEFSETQLRVLELFLKRLSASGINAVFWSPPVHPELESARSALLDAERQSQAIEMIRAAGFDYVPVNQAELNCRYWTDASHLSDRCAPAVIRMIQERSPAFKTAAGG
ncbi:MAG: DUF1574 domain-containing protein [bacterium]|nr:DUF1574 domain-containing protein [bacterium]